ncbi:hypothetical protein CFOL_v3_15587, partial [Cephalotus follicularis]
MASPESSMDFRSRVSKIFDSLGSTKSALQQKPWSLTDDEIERREWRRQIDTNGRDERPCSASFDHFVKEKRRSRNPKKGLDDDDDGGGNEEVSDDESLLRSAIGLDPTLDHEDEEDEYDKVASGRFYNSERVYMSDVTIQGSHLNMHNVIPNQLCGTTKDPRANHLAAKFRLKEDDAEAKTFTSHAGDTEMKKPQPRSILKRKGKENDKELKSQKRVRFDPGCKSYCEEASDGFQDSFAGTCPMDATVSDVGFLQPQNVSVVPDYLLNPSRYTRYSFDSSSKVEESNTQTFTDILQMVNWSGLEFDYGSADLHKLTFIPKKKACDVKAVVNHSSKKQNKEDDSKQTLHQAGFPVGIAFGETKDSEVSSLEEDEPETNAADNMAAIQKPSRRYRTMSMSDVSD